MNTNSVLTSSGSATLVFLNKYHIEWPELGYGVSAPVLTKVQGAIAKFARQTIFQQKCNKKIIYC
jgi:hypothetical protein